MNRQTRTLPQLGGQVFLADGGIETSLIYLENLDLPYFAAYHLLRNEDGKETLRNYFRTYARLARDAGTGVVLESATWRASADWGRLLGDDEKSLARLNREAIVLLEELRQEPEFAGVPIVVSGCIGPRGDGYRADAKMSVEEAAQYHAQQAEILSSSGADLITAITMTYPEEAIGITRAATAADLPVVISFTVETDGRLPSGHTLGEAIALVDGATGNAPAYYMINCAHPGHFENALDPGAPWASRVRGVRANASALSHAELDAATELHAGNPDELGAEYRELFDRLPALAVLGGCCGTDHRHIKAIAVACAAKLTSSGQRDQPAA